MIKHNKYWKIYNQIIDKAISENRNIDDEYYESHHIVPKSIRPDLSKDKSNQVLLTAREHFICHYLLTKFTISKNKAKMIYAFRCFFILDPSNKQERYINSLFYENNKKEQSKIHSERMSGDKNPFYKQKHTEETKQKISESKIGKPGMKGDDNPATWEWVKEKLRKPKTEDTKRKMSLAKKGKCTGSKNNNAKKINIYNSNDELMFECYGNFSKICKENNFPENVLSNSYKNGGTPIYKNYNNNKYNYLQYKGWYAKIIN